MDTSSDISWNSCQGFPVGVWTRDSDCWVSRMSNITQLKYQEIFYAPILCPNWLGWLTHMKTTQTFDLIPIGWQPTELAKAWDNNFRMHMLRILSPNNCWKSIHAMYLLPFWELSGQLYTTLQTRTVSIDLWTVEQTSYQARIMPCGSVGQTILF
jgi:hypothetical protein